MLIEEFIIRAYCEITEALEAVKGAPLRTRGFAPSLTDAELLTMELVGAYLGYVHDKKVWMYFRQHWQVWFPNLKSRSTFVRQAANLWEVKRRLQQYWAKRLGAYGNGVHLVDGFPVPVCHFRRAHFSRIFDGEAAYGHCASKGTTYYGFKGMLVTNDQGVIVDIALVPANIDERDALDELNLQRISGMLLGDKGFIRPALTQRLAQEGIDLQTPRKANMKEDRSRIFLHWMQAQRGLVETVIGQLAGRFSIEDNWARDLWHLTSRIYRKIASHTLCFWINRHSDRPLALEKMLAS